MTKRKKVFVVTWKWREGTEEKFCFKHCETWDEAAALMRALLMFDEHKVEVARK